MLLNRSRKSQPSEYLHAIMLVQLDFVDEDLYPQSFDKLQRTEFDLRYGFTKIACFFHQENE